MNQFMMNQFAAAVNNKNNGMDVPFAGTQQGMINPQTLMYQNQLMYQALQDPATVAYLIQQQQQLQVQLQQQAQAQLLARNQEKPANITDLWAQRSQQLFGASGNQKFGKSGRGSSTTKKNLNKMPKMRPDGRAHV